MARNALLDAVLSDAGHALWMRDLSDNIEWTEVKAR
jgi:hypothetical protein